MINFPCTCLMQSICNSIRTSYIVGARALYSVTLVALPSALAGRARRQGGRDGPFVAATCGYELLTVASGVWRRCLPAAEDQMSTVSV